ncbi:MAG TPA: hypothetical protein VGS15_08505 [Candidatus Acidoferrales bacterium]|nr:hypothetical protein [Candidatus Acidoferrales bacterium]
MRIQCAAVVCFVLALAGCSSLSLQDDNHPATVQDLVGRYVAANNAQDAAAMNALLHPKSLACITPENRDFYDRANAVSMRQSIPADYKFTDTVLSEKDALPMNGYATFPVRPTHQIQIDYSRGVETSGTVMFWLVSENGRWYKDDPCATAGMVKQFHDDLPNIKAREQATKGLVAQIREPLLSELKSLLKEGKGATASKRYGEATGEDGDTSLMVIDELEFQLRQQKVLQ